MKVFGIGLSKTGTHSLTEALNRLGYRAEHFICAMQAIRYVKGKLIIDFDKIDGYDSLSDTPIARIYKELDLRYPGSKFVLTVRDMDGWLRSCERHFGSQPSGRWDLIRKLISPTVLDKTQAHLYGAIIEKALPVLHVIRKKNRLTDLDRLHLDLYHAVYFEKMKFTAAYQRHEQDVRDYFRERRDDLLVLNICDGEGYEKLAPFLKKSAPDESFPKLFVSKAPPRIF